MKGFSRKETVAYYEDINKRAWEEVEASDTPEIKSQKFDENLEWTMLDKNYDDRTQKTFSQGPVFVPMWWGNFDPTYPAGQRQPYANIYSFNPFVWFFQTGKRFTYLPYLEQILLPPW